MQSQAALIEAVSRPYLAVGYWAYYFVRTKLTYDPVYLTLLRAGRFPDGARVLDLGCGHAMLAALMLTARQHFESGIWSGEWLAPPAGLNMTGIDAQGPVVKKASVVLGDRVSIRAADLREVTLPQADVVVMVDVLQCMDHGAQVALLKKIVRALSANGLLVLRVPDGSAGWRFQLGKASDRFGVPFARRVFASYHHRTLGEWLGLLESLGFQPSVDRTRQTFANTVVWAKAP
jgi:SAM-dependent methyltransferase